MRAQGWIPSSIRLRIVCLAGLDLGFSCLTFLRRYYSPLHEKNRPLSILAKLTEWRERSDLLLHPANTVPFAINLSTAISSNGRLSPPPSSGALLVGGRAPARTARGKWQWSTKKN
jgi:hypothetical protein